MESFDSVIFEVDAFDRHLSRRSFLGAMAFAGIATRLTLDGDDREFLRRVAGTLIPPAALARTGIDVLANIDHLLARGSAEHRAKALRLIAWARRVSFLYGGERVALRSRGSRFALVQKMGKALSSICLVAFWGDERALPLIEAPAPASLGVGGEGEPFRNLDPPATNRRPLTAIPQ